MIEITHDINKQFGKKFTDFRSEEFVAVQQTFRKIFNMFKVEFSTCIEIKSALKPKYQIKAVSEKKQEEEIIEYLKQELEENSVSFDEMKKEYVCLVPCRPYIVNPKTKEKIEADDFDITIFISFYENQEEMLK